MKEYNVKNIPIKEYKIILFLFEWKITLHIFAHGDMKIHYMKTF